MVKPIVVSEFVFQSRYYVHFQANTPGKGIVAERTSYFCLARKLIWPLWLSHIFTQWGWLIPFSPDHFPRQHENSESPPNYLFLRTFWAGRMYFLSVPFIAAESQHHSESHLIYGPFESTLLDQGFPVEHELYAYRNTFMSPLTFALSTAMRNYTQTPSYLIPGHASFLLYASLLQQPGPYIYGWLHHSCP